MQMTDYQHIFEEIQNGFGETIYIDKPEKNSNKLEFVINFTIL